MKLRWIEICIHAFQTILLVFSVCGGLLCMIDLLGIVLACCMASQIAHNEEIMEDRCYGERGGQWTTADQDQDDVVFGSRPGTPRHIL